MFDDPVQVPFSLTAGLISQVFPHIIVVDDVGDRLGVVGVKFV